MLKAPGRYVGVVALDRTRWYSFFTCETFWLQWGLMQISFRMFIPVGPDGGMQDVWNVDKDENGTVTKTRLFGVRVSRFLPSLYSNRVEGTALPREWPLLDNLSKVLTLCPCSTSR